jgi:hypothetical protein
VLFCFFFLASVVHLSKRRKEPDTVNTLRIAQARKHAQHPLQSSAKKKQECKLRRKGGGANTAGAQKKKKQDLPHLHHCCCLLRPSFLFAVGVAHLASYLVLRVK